VLDAQDDHFVEVFVNAVENAVGTPARGPHPGQVIPQRFTDPVGLADQCRGQELDHCCGDRLGQLAGQGTARWRGEDELVTGLAAHRRSWRTASTPRMTSPRA